MITFTAGGSTTAPIPSFMINNDIATLETKEEYELSLSSPSVTDDVVLGPNTAVEISDDDSETLVYMGGHYYSLQVLQ